MIDALRAFSTPSVANAIETFDVRPRSAGYTDGTITCRFPELGVLVGYAATATIRSREPGPSDATRELWRHILTVPEPRIVVVQDLDDPPGAGSFWGEVNANIHQAFGCIGVITNGCVRDLDEMRMLAFHAFSASVCVSHAYVHVESAGEPVTVGGLTVRPGDLLHADAHGVLEVPHALVDKLPDAVRAVEKSERDIIAMFRSPDFNAHEFAG